MCVIIVCTVAPEDTPYAERAPPPQSLDNYDAGFTCNYHLYRVVKSFRTETGPIAPGFGQPGLGLQFQVVSFLLPGDPPLCQRDVAGQQRIPAKRELAPRLLARQ